MEARRRVTLKTVARLAAGLHRMRGVSWLIAAGASAWFLVAVLRTTGGSIGALGALSLLLWAALALGAGALLSQPPPALLHGDGWRRRIGKRMRWLAYWLAIAMAVVLAGVATSMSLRALRLAFA